VTPCRWTTNITEDRNPTPCTAFHLFNLLKPSGHYMYHQFNIHKSHVLPTLCIYNFVWISEQTAFISLYSINWLVSITETECVYCAVRIGSLNTTKVIVRLWRTNAARATTRLQLFSFRCPLAHFKLLFQFCLHRLRHNRAWMIVVCFFSDFACYLHPEALWLPAPSWQMSAINFEIRTTGSPEPH
jgi:hypothetical protein